MSLSHALKVTLNTIAYNPNPCHRIDIGYQIIFVIIFMKKFLDAVYKINVREYRIINGQSWETGTQENEQRHSTICVVHHYMCIES